MNDNASMRIVMVNNGLLAVEAPNAVSQTRKNDALNPVFKK